MRAAFVEHVRTALRARGDALGYRMFRFRRPPPRKVDAKVVPHFGKKRRARKLTSSRRSPTDRENDLLDLGQPSAVEGPDDGNNPDHQMQVGGRMPSNDDDED